MEQLGWDVAQFFHHLFSPQTLTSVIAVGTVVYQIIKKLQSEQKRAVQKDNDAMNKRLESIEANAKDAHEDLMKEILRLQLLEGIESKRLSSSEVRYFYDKYRSVGGNSFVSSVVCHYLKDLGEDDNDDKTDN